MTKTYFNIIMVLNNTFVIGTYFPFCNAVCISREIWNLKSTPCVYRWESANMVSISQVRLKIKEKRLKRKNTPKIKSLVHTKDWRKSFGISSEWEKKSGVIKTCYSNSNIQPFGEKSASHVTFAIYRHLDLSSKFQGPSELDNPHPNTI